jgi:hypothetical protein
MNGRALRFSLAIALTALLSLLSGANAAYGSGSSKIDPRVCPSAAEVASGLHLKILTRSTGFSPRRGQGLWSVEQCEYLTDVNNRSDQGYMGIYGTHVVIEYWWPESLDEMEGKRDALNPPVENVSNLGQIAFEQVKYHFLYVENDSVGMSLSTPETALPQMIKFAKKFF